jgi:hypothetical protein
VRILAILATSVISQLGATLAAAEVFGLFPLKILLLFFFLRHVTAWFFAYLAARFTSAKMLHVLFTALPAVLLLHGTYIYVSNGALELWPPILIADFVFYLAMVSFFLLGKKHNKGS